MRRVGAITPLVSGLPSLPKASPTQAHLTPGQRSLVHIRPSGLALAGEDGARGGAWRTAARSSFVPGVGWLARLEAVTVDEGEQVGVDGVVVAGVQAMPGTGVDGEAGCRDEFGGLAAGECDRG